MIEIRLDLGDRSYPVVVGAGARDRLADFIPASAHRAAVVTQAGIPWAVETGIEQQTFILGDGEEAKNLSSIEALCRDFARWNLHRNDVVVAVGGGVVTDAAGFAAAVYHRGVAVIHVPTTLLGQVDAAIGGKTGVNLPEGKNLVGAFWQPCAVICDTDTLTTLPPREYRGGLGEMAKYRFLGVDALQDLPMDQAVAACVECKASYVRADEREAGIRAHLNYGHTLGHALETAGGYDLRHGEAVAIGLVYAARLAHRLGRISAERVGQHEQIVRHYDLPAQPPPGIDPAHLVEIMGRDKKALGQGLTFVLDGPDGIEVVDGVTPDIAASTLGDWAQ